MPALCASRPPDVKKVTGLREPLEETVAWRVGLWHAINSHLRKLPQHAQTSGDGADVERMS